MSDEFSVRPGTVADIDVLARHRAAMFRDMGSLPETLYDAMCDAARLYFAQAMTNGEYLSWLATPSGAPGKLIAGAGMQLRPALPHLRKAPDGVHLTSGLQGLIVNVYTEPAWRRRGLAALLMRYVLDGARAHKVGSLVLHASPQGRKLYEALGFVPTNEMRYSGPTDLGAELD
jgi:ribosomal protein S18 acetylase RimI-like enzyme